MCNIAGYVGTKPAAPILIDMMRRQEGFDAGFYTGIATIHEGRIYCAKVAGSLETLLKETDAASLPGNIGIIHGRTPGSKWQDAQWGHPFTTVRDGETVSALVANGGMGFFEPRLPERIAAAERVRAAGYGLKTAYYKPDANFKLSDDITMHYSDVLCQLVTWKVDQGMDTAVALEKAVCEHIGEIVTLYLNLCRPDGISFARVNMPMHLNFVDHGAYLATTPMAFPEDAGEPQLLPAMSSGFVSKDGVIVRPFPEPPATVAQLDSRAYHDLYDMIYRELHREGGITKYTVGDLKALFQPAELYPAAAAFYRILYDINKTEPVNIRVEQIPGQKEGQTAPKFYAYL